MGGAGASVLLIKTPRGRCVLSSALGGVTVTGLASTVCSDKIGDIKIPKGRSTSGAAAVACHGPASDAIPRAAINKQRRRDRWDIFRS